MAIETSEECITVQESKALVEPSHFISVMDLLLKEPNIISPQILRAEIDSDVTIENIRVINRRLIPRRYQLDNILSQIVTIKTDAENISVSFIATNETLPYYYPKFKEFMYNFDIS
jgi:hypothetical protein